MRRGRRFLAYSMGALAAASAAGRVATRGDRRRPDPAADDHLGSVRGTPRVIRGPRASRIYTERFAPGEGSLGTVILTHGYCLTEAVWHYQKRDLAGGRFALVTWDLPGHGMSPPARGRVTVDFAVDSLARVIEEYADGPVVLAGHSLGGIVSLGYLTRRPEAHGRIRGVVLVSTPMMHFAQAAAGRWPGASLEARALGGVMQALVQSDLADRLLGRDVGHPEVGRLSYRLVRWGFGRNPSPTQVRFIRDVLASVEPRVRAETFRVMTGYDLTPVLPEITTPALVVIGDRDRLVNPEESRVLAERLPRGRALVFPDAGHAAFMERPKRFNAAVRRFAEARLRDRPGQDAEGAGSA